MAAVIDKTTVTASTSTTPDVVNGHNKADTLVNATEMITTATIKEVDHSAGE